MSESIESRVIKCISEQSGLQKSLIRPSSLLNRLQLDSLDILESVMIIEDEFEIEISDDDVDEFSTVQDMINCVTRVMK